MIPPTPWLSPADVILPMTATVEDVLGMWARYHGWTSAEQVTVLARYLDAVDSHRDDTDRHLYTVAQSFHTHLRNRASLRVGSHHA